LAATAAATHQFACPAKEQDFCAFLHFGRFSGSISTVLIPLAQILLIILWTTFKQNIF
jgi:hypothetical protein